jgi:stage V sporulation protein R
MTRKREHDKQRIAEELEPDVEALQEKTEELGLSPRDVRYWINHNEEVNKLAAYGGFQRRYPHWRWGMKYDKQKKQNQFGGGKIFELVINSDPCHAYLQMSNRPVEQKAVIAHVEAHSDFFANNEWFPDDPDAVDMLARHGEKIEQYMNDSDISREEVERWIDHILCLEDNIDQYTDYVYRQSVDIDSREDVEENDGIPDIDVSDEVLNEVFGNDDDEESFPMKKSITDNTTKDILGFLISEGQQYDEDREVAVEYEDWQLDILDMLREEAYYFAPQKMTKVINEGHAAYWESMMMMDEGYADVDEIIDYADQHSKVVQAGQFNPYRLGKSLWEYIENTVNRREVVDKLLRIEGVTPDNFHRMIDFDAVHEALNHPDSDDPAKRNYSLARLHNEEFIQSIDLKELRKMNRYIVERDRYDELEEALYDVDYGRGWRRMREVRETHNDVMFVDEFLTQEFVDRENYFAYEFRAANQRFEISSKDVEDVKKKMLLEMTNFGKPTIEVADGNFDNSGELLLLHRYNGVVLDMEKSHNVLKRVFNLWGRPVNLVTVGKYAPEKEVDYALSEGIEPEYEEFVVRVRYDGEEFDEFDVVEGDLVDAVVADEIDYKTVPEEWQ